MNAEVIPGLARSPRREDYESIVKGLIPFVDGEELVLRSSLLLMRDKAIATKPHASLTGYTLLEIVEREASDNALNRRVSIEQLRELRRLVINCVMAASGFDAFYRPTSPDEGEANASGA